MSGFTPGPWTAQRTKQIAGITVAPGWFISPDQGEKPVLDIAHVHLSASQNEKTQEANARLMASAPELLRELEAARKVIADALDNMPYLFPAKGIKASLTPEQSAWREKLQAASKSARTTIAKAKTA